MNSIRIINFLLVFLLMLFLGCASNPNKDISVSEMKRLEENKTRIEAFFPVLAKQCKPLINKNLEINRIPIRELSFKDAKKLMEAQVFMADEQYEESIAILTAMESKANDNYTKAVLNRNLGYAYAQSDHMNDALVSFNKALTYGQNNLPHEILQTLRENVAGLLYSNDNKNKAVFIMEEWLKNSNKDVASAYYMLAAMYADKEIDRIKDALCPAYFAVTSSEEPKESYYVLLNLIQYELQDYMGSVNTLEVMIKHFPEEVKYKRYLAYVYEKLAKNDRAFEILSALHAHGELETRKAYETLAKLYKKKNDLVNEKKILNEAKAKGLLDDKKKK